MGEDAKDNADQFVALNGEHIDSLLAEKHRSGAAPGVVLRGAFDKPEGLSAATVHAWLDGSEPSARVDHYDYMLKRWRACGRVIPLDNKLRSALLAEKQRTGIGPQRLLHGRRDNSQGLSAAVIDHWLSGAVTARQDHIEYVLALWRTRAPLVTLTPDHRMVRDYDKCIRRAFFAMA